MGLVRRLRKINLNWQPKRWESEHSKLSRAITLLHLSENLVQYDLEGYEEHLPEQWPGYVIRNSRRLGMEGLRQRHCVASYHDQIVRGSCAIAAVFVEGKRWTVQLVKSDNETIPLRITQIKSVLNAMPSVETRAEIHRAMDIEQSTNGASGPLPEEPHTYRDNLRQVLPVLIGLQINSVDVYFDGSGDSGCIEDIQFYRREESLTNISEEISGSICTISKLDRSFDQGVWRVTADNMEVQLDEAIIDIVDDYLEETGVDWYNNDGGFGQFSIDVGEGSCSLEVSQRHTQDYIEFDREMDIQTGELL